MTEKACDLTKPCHHYFPAMQHGSTCQCGAFRVVVHGVGVFTLEPVDPSSDVLL